MEDRPRGPLTALKWAAVAAVAVGGAVWLAPWAVRAVVTRGSPSTLIASAEPAPEADSDQVDRFVAAGLDAAGATVLVQREEDGVVRTIAELPRDADRDALARRLREQAEQAGVELYTATVDDLDVEVRAYTGQRLRHQALLVPRVPADPVPPSASNRRTRAQLALIVAGVGASDGGRVITRRVPLTIAVEPFQPFALKAARAAALSWHEVLVQLPPTTAATPAPSHGPDPDTLAALAAVPYASGVLVEGKTVPMLPDDPFSVVVHPSGGGRDPTSRLRLLAAQRGGRRTAWEALARTRFLAGRDGVAAVVFDIDDPGLEGVLDWAEGPRARGYRLVLASEAVRWQDVRGSTDPAGADQPAG